ncbi:MAG TPA: hypothetical protein VFO39_10165 [Candidatus Sulfotelmatobacter sp.]|nr:hypothetical protein [Candidatus Sulfotelmatobacter sp.]
MRAGPKLISSIVIAFCFCGAAAVPLWASTRPQKHAKKPALPPPLPAGPQGPVPQVPLDSIPPIAPQVSYVNGQLTIVAPNSTLGDILRVVRKQTGAEIEIPSGATERVVTHLGPGPAREVVADLLNGSHFNYVLLGSAADMNQLTRVVLVPKSPESAPGAPGQPANQVANVVPVQDATAQDAMDAEAPPDENATDDSANVDQNAATEGDQQQPIPTDQQQQPGIRTPQQMLMEMQQRQLQMQQQQVNPGQYPGMPVPPPSQQPQQ